MTDHSRSPSAGESTGPIERMTRGRILREELARGISWRRMWKTSSEARVERAEETPPQRCLVRVATQLRQDEFISLQSVLEKHFGGLLELDVEMDPTILGGVWVRVGDTVIDGSLRGRLEALRRHLRVQCRVMVRDCAGLTESGVEVP